MIRNNTNQLTIRPKMSSTVVMALVVAGLLAIILIAYFSYSSGIKKGYGQSQTDVLLVSQLKDSAASLKDELTQTQEQLIFAQRQHQIQEEAYKQLSKAYSNSEQKNSVLGTRLDFYRSIISPEDGQAGPAIQSLDHHFADGQLSFDITLVQAIKHKHQVRGTLRVSLYENEKVIAKWPLSSSRSISYQYFQQISGSIEAAKMADNAKIKVELTLQGGEKLERWFPLPRASTQTES